VAEGGQTINDYINEYWEDDIVKMGSQFPIKHITNLSLKVILYNIVHIVGYNSLHLASWEKM
jgi:hypothetical protein